jgi:hypothetical protein
MHPEKAAKSAYQKEMGGKKREIYRPYIFPEPSLSKGPGVSRRKTSIYSSFPPSLATERNTALVNKKRSVYVTRRRGAQRRIRIYGRVRKSAQTI